MCDADMMTCVRVCAIYCILVYPNKLISSLLFFALVILQLSNCSCIFTQFAPGLESLCQWVLPCGLVVVVFFKLSLKLAGAEVMNVQRK